MPSVINSCYYHQYSAISEKKANGSSPWGNANNCTTFPKLPSSPPFNSFNCFPHLAGVWPHLNPQRRFNPHPFFLAIPSFPLSLFLMASFSWYHHQGKFARWEESMECSSKTSASGRVFYWNHKQYCISYTIVYREGGRKAWWKTVNVCVCVWGGGWRVYGVVNELGRPL